MSGQSISQILWTQFSQDFKLYKPLEDTLNPKTKSLLPKDQVEDSLMQIDLLKLTAWSENNAELYENLVTKGFLPEILNRENLKRFYKQLKLESCRITEIDPEFRSFVKLRELNVNRNKVQILENLPPNIQELHAYGNNLTKIRFSHAFNNLTYLGLGHNQLDDSCLEGLASKAPNLLGLDLAYNYISQIDTTVDQLMSYRRLKMINLFGNPISIIPEYRKLILDVLKSLKVLDNIATEEELDPPVVKEEPIVEEPQPVVPDPKAKGGKNDKKGSKKEEQKKDDKKGKAGTKKDDKKVKEEAKKVEPEPALEQTNADLGDLALDLNKIPEKAAIKLLIYIATLENIDGFNLNDEYNANGDKPSDLYQSIYWIRYQAFGQEFTSQQVPFQSATIEDEKARIEFEFKKEIKLEELDADFFKEGLIIEVNVAQPKLEETENPDEKKVLLINGEPTVQKSLLGGCRIDLKMFLEQKPKLKSENKLKYPLFTSDALRTPDLYVANKDEKKQVQAFEDEERQKNEELKQQEEAAATDKKKGGKAPAKKDAKKDVKKGAKKGGKNDVIEAKHVPLLDWPEATRDKIYISRSRKVVKALPCLLAVHSAVVTK